MSEEIEEACKKHSKVRLNYFKIACTKCLEEAEDKGREETLQAFKNKIVENYKICKEKRLEEHVTNQHRANFQQRIDELEILYSDVFGVTINEARHKLVEGFEKLKAQQCTRCGVLKENHYPTGRTAMIWDCSEECTDFEEKAKEKKS